MELVSSPQKISLQHDEIQIIPHSPKVTIRLSLLSCISGKGALHVLIVHDIHFPFFRRQLAIPSIFPIEFDVSGACKSAIPLAFDSFVLLGDNVLPLDERDGSVVLPTFTGTANHWSYLARSRIPSSEPVDRIGHVGVGRRGGEPFLG